MTIKYLCVIVQSIYLFMIHKANRAHKQEAVHPDIFLGVASFLFCLGFGGVERVKSTGAGTDDRSI